MLGTARANQISGGACLQPITWKVRTKSTPDRHYRGLWYLENLPSPCSKTIGYGLGSLSLKARDLCKKRRYISNTSLLNPKPKVETQESKLQTFNLRQNLLLSGNLHGLPLDL